MPNWCDNTLVVFGGTAKQRKQWVLENTSKENEGVDFNGSVPMPEGEDGNTNYNWSINNWSTKWNAVCCQELITIKRDVRYGFDTAWGPPTNWFTTMARKYPHLKFDLHYMEPGMCYIGELYSRKGVITYAERSNDELTDDDKQAMGYTPCECCNGWEEECMCD
jgi:hypothetical protein